MYQIKYYDNFETKMKVRNLWKNPVWQ